jgi:F-type H+-transporting ATPase subunit delta
MLIPRVARRYAQAMYEAVPAEVGAEALLADLRDLQASLDGSRDLRSFFTSPVIPQAQKRDTVNALFDGRLRPYTVEALLFLVDKGREHQLLEILAAIFELDRDRKGIQSMTVSTSLELDAAQRGSVTSAITALVRKPVDASFRADDSLLGGIVVRVGDTVYDGSVKRQLQLLRERFISGTA